MRIGFRGASFLATPAIVDLNSPPPQPAQAILHIQQYDQQQAQTMSQIHTQNAQMSHHGLQAPSPSPGVP